MAGDELIITCGLQGVGKSKVARFITDKRGFLLLRTDEISEEAVGEPTYTEEGVFTDEYIEKRYSELMRMIGEALKRGGSVVVDATFNKRKNRERARQIAMEAGADFQIIQVTCPEEIVEERMKRRENDASTATFAHHLAYKKRFESFFVNERPPVVIGNEGTLEELRERVNTLF